VFRRAVLVKFVFRLFGHGVTYAEVRIHRVFPPDFALVITN
jgi:hypothetical protein